MSLLGSPQKPNRLLSGHQRGEFRALGERDTLKEFDYARILLWKMFEFFPVRVTPFDLKRTSI